MLEKKEYLKNWKKNNPNYSKEYRQKNLDKYKRYDINRKERLKIDHQYRLFRNSYRNARRRGWDFQITRSDIIIPRYCPILGLELKYYEDNMLHDDRYSIDRIDSSVGYTKDNIEVISLRANTLKKDATIDEIKAVIYYLSNNINYNNLEENINSKNIVPLLLEKSKHRSKEKGIEFNLQKEDIFVPKYCPVLNIEIFKCKRHICNNSPTIDRFDSNGGYVKDNIRVISNRANLIKADGTIEEFKKVLEYLNNIYLKKKQK